MNAADELRYMRDQGVDRVTVYHIAAITQRRVKDVRFALWCGGITEDDMTTVPIDAILATSLGAEA